MNSFPAAPTSWATAIAVGYITVAWTLLCGQPTIFHLLDTTGDGAVREVAPNLVHHAAVVKIILFHHVRRRTVDECCKHCTGSEARISHNFTPARGRVHGFGVLHHRLG